MVRKKFNRAELEAIGIERARQIRERYNLGIDPINNVFDIIEQEGIILLRYPSNHQRLHAFFGKIKNRYVVYINSNEPLGRQNFSGAHELCHYFFDRKEMENIFLCDPGNLYVSDEREIIADAFASEFLMPKEGLERVFTALFGRPNRITAKHVIIMQNKFRVSYAAMLYALYKAGIITSGKIYGRLKKVGSIENEEILKNLSIKYAKSIELLEKTPPKCSPIFLEAITHNFEKGLISFAKFESLLSILNLKPEDLGYSRHEI